MASDGEAGYCSGEDNYYSDDDDSNTDDIDSIVYDDGEDWQLEEEESDEEEQSKERKVAVVDNTKADRRYRNLTEDQLRARQDADTAKVGELFSIPEGFAAVLLRHYKWSLVELQDKLFSDDRVGVATGVALDGVPTLLSDQPLVCGVCFDQYPAGETRSAGCSHFYCHGCWRGYVHEAVRDGPRCLSFRCPEPECSAAVVRELVDEVADDEDRARYAAFSLRSYVEESSNIKWCPGPGCTVAMEFVGGGEDKQYDVECEHGHEFCWRCGEEAHRPVSCDTVRAWLEKNAAESGTASWVLESTKHCPQCRRAIEKNQGCMHMTCRPPCRHEFCWLCLRPWKDNMYAGHSCNQYNQDKDKGTLLNDDECRRRQGMASLDRYIYFYERYSAHGMARSKAAEDMAELQIRGGSLERLSEAAGVPVTELCFLREAYRQIVECRRILQWTYAYGYYHLGETAARDDERNMMIECAQGEAERQLEKLHHCVEQERTDLVDRAWYALRAAASSEMAAVESEKGAVADEVNTYRQKLMNLTAICKSFFRTLVKSFQDGLLEAHCPRHVAPPSME